ncbi:MAG: hypothetical protein HN610_18435 [Verrucomicrobia bacterium]|nr:hypothetical protein [Verrucomicrobiota bacterium]
MRCGNIDFTTALSLLLSRKDFRDRLRDSPDALLDEWNMSPSDRACLLALNHEPLSQQADGLISKRFHEVRQFIPRTLKALPMRGRKLFFKFADDCWPEGHQRHLLDALGFARFLEQEGGDVSPNRFELTWLSFLIGDRKWSFHLLSDFPWKDRIYYAIVFFYRTRGGTPRYGAFTLPRWRRGSSL